MSSKLILGVLFVIFAGCFAEKCDFNNEFFNDPADFVIVGSGPASGPVIFRLVEAGKKVVVLEKGPEFDSSDGKKPPDDDLRYQDSIDVGENVFKQDSDYPNFLELAAKRTFKIRKHRINQKSKSFLELEREYLRNPTFKRFRAYPYQQVQGFGGQSLTYGGLCLRPSAAAFNKGHLDKTEWPESYSWANMKAHYKKAELSHFYCGINQEAAAHSHSCGNFQGKIDVISGRGKNYPTLTKPSVGKFCTAKAATYKWTDLKSEDENAPFSKDYNADDNMNYEDEANRPVRAFCGSPQYWGKVSLTENQAEKEFIRATLDNTYVTKDWRHNKREKLKVCTETRVNRLIFHANHDELKIVSAEVAGHNFRVKGNRFIIAAGVFHTPSLLMSSGIGDKAQFEKLGIPNIIDLKAVGKYFHDEWAYALSYKIKEYGNVDGGWIHNGDQKKGKDIVNRDQMHLIKWSTGAWGKDFTDVQLYLRIGNKLSLDYYLPSDLSGSIKCCNTFAIRIAMFQKDSFGAKSGVFAKSSNGVFIDRFDYKVEMFGTKELRNAFMKGAISGMKVAKELMAEMKRETEVHGKKLVLEPTTVTAMTEKAFEEDELAGNTYPKFEHAITDYANVLALHGGGTARIGTDKAKSVVDVNLKVHDVTNLYICDMSVLPAPVDANPTATLFALGEKFAAYAVNL